MPDKNFKVRCGAPYHGLVRDSEMVLPNNEVIPYIQPTYNFGSNGSRKNGFNKYLKSSFAPGSGLSIEDELTLKLTKGYQWKDHVLLAGSHHDIAGTGLGLNDWVYIDPVGTSWRMSLEVVLPVQPSDGYHQVPFVTITVTVESRFGYFSINTNYDGTVDAEIFNDNLSTLPPDIWYKGPHYDDWYFYTVYGNGFLIEPNNTGSEVLIHWYSDHDNVFVQPNGPHIIFDEQDALGLTYWGRPFLLTHLWKVSVSGTGSLDPDTLGAGIGVTVIEKYPSSNLWPVTTGGGDPGISYVDTYVLPPAPHHGGRVERVVFDSNNNEVVFVQGVLDNNEYFYRNGVLIYAKGSPGEWCELSNNIYGVIDKGPDDGFGHPQYVTVHHMIGPEGVISPLSIQVDNISTRWFKNLQVTFDWENQEVVAEGTPDKMCYV